MSGGFRGKGLGQGLLIRGFKSVGVSGFRDALKAFRGATLLFRLCSLQPPLAKARAEWRSEVASLDEILGTGSLEGLDPVDSPEV